MNTTGPSDPPTLSEESYGRGAGCASPTGSPLFFRGQLLRHLKTGMQYCVTETPSAGVRLEHCNEPFYAYRSYGTDSDHVIWLRAQSEMEDGRFVAEPQKPGVTIKNGNRYCAGCGEFLGMTCDPFGRSECGNRGCKPAENDQGMERRSAP